MRRTSSTVKLAHNSDSSLSLPMSVSPKHHTYSLGVMALALDLASHACLGNRQVVKVLEVISKYIGFLDQIPCYNTVRYWVSKRGFYQLVNNRESYSKDSTWAIIADVSIRVGGQRLLLVLGINLEEYDFERPLTFGDVHVLSLGLRRESSWSAKAIKEHLEEQVLKYYQVAYLVSDSGPCIKSAARQLEIPRIDDVSHAFARILKRTYNKRADFEYFIKKCTHLRRYNTINPDSHLRPPQLRGTARFMNVASLVKWATAMLQVLDVQGTIKYKGKAFTARHRAKVEWLIEMRPFIEQLSATLAVMDKIAHWVKHHGLSLQTVAMAKISLENDERVSLIEPKVYEEITSYLDGELATVERLELPSVICSTDIVESFFGRYKQRVPKVAMVNVYALRIIAYGKQIQSCEQVKEIMESTSLKRLKEWRSNLDSHAKTIDRRSETIAA